MRINAELRLLMGKNQIFCVHDDIIDVTTTLVTAVFLLKQIKCTPVILPQCGEFQIYGQFR